MFPVRSRPHHVVQDIFNDPDSQEFVEEQLKLFRMIVDGASPRAIVVVNAFASHLIRKGRALGALDYDEELGVDIYIRLARSECPSSIRECCLERMLLITDLSIG